MIRSLSLAVAMVAALLTFGQLPAALSGDIIPETTAARHGLTRPWFTQVQMDLGRSRVRYVVFYEDTLYVQTDSAMVHAIDAETGETLWAKIVGRPGHPSMVPGVNRDLVAILNGSRLYVCNRYNGDLLYETEVGGAPGSGAALSEQRAYVPMVNGMVMAYRLETLTDPLFELGKIKENLTDEDKAQLEEDRRENLRLRQEYIPPLSCRSLGQAVIQPLVTCENEGEEYVAWPTDRGFLNVGRVDRRRDDERLTITYRLETDDGIAARPSYLPPNSPTDSGLIIGVSRDGFVHAIREKDGSSSWRFSTGEPILEPAAVIDDRIYVCTQSGGIHSLESETGRELWWAPQVRRFIAASKQHVYVEDKVGRILVLRAETGARLDVIPTTAMPIKLQNCQTDRIYLCTETGLLQCLHEVEQVEPIRHGEARRKAALGETPAEEDAPDGADKPEAPANQTVPAADDPFGGGGAGAGAGAAADDPFGGGGAGAGDAADDPLGGGGDGAGAAADDPFGGGDAGSGAGGGDAGDAVDDPFGGVDPFS